MTTQPPNPGLPLGLRYYVLRGGAMIPLVPADQLPFQLQDIPRQLTHRQLSDEGWKLLKETEEPVLPIPLQTIAIASAPIPSTSEKPSFFAPDHHVRSSSKATERVSTPLRIARDLSILPVDKTMTISTGLVQSAPMERPAEFVSGATSLYRSRSQESLKYPSGLVPDQSKKEFCTHWIKTGECAFTSIGCKYKHEMPPMARLRELGFTQMPKWWKEKSAIVVKSPTWMQRRLASGAQMQEQGSEVTPQRSFLDTVALRNVYNEQSKQPRDITQHEQKSVTRVLASESATVCSPAAPGSTRHAPTQPASKPTELLIDLDDILTTDPEASLKSHPANSAEPQARINQTIPSLPQSSFAVPIATSKEQEIVQASVPATRKTLAVNQQMSNCQPLGHRHSSISSASSSDEDNDFSKPPTKPVSMRAKPHRPTSATAKQPGLAFSKHAPHKEAADAGRHAVRKTTRSRADKESIAGLRAQIDQLRREVHRTERARGSDVNE